MTQETLLVCGNCNETVPVSTMKYNSSADFLICGSCYNKEHGICETEQTVSVETKEPVVKKQVVITTTDHLGYERISFQCTHCGYKSSRKKEAHFNTQCPYCGRSTAEAMHKPTAEEVVEGASGIFRNIDSMF